MVEISGRGKRRKQDESLNMENHIWIKKGTKMYLKQDTGEVKIK